MTWNKLFSVFVYEFQNIRFMQKTKKKFTENLWKN